ncbi:MAG: MFS transporter [Oscillospiraceae bacterium]|jgi:MFS family permease|nr:MFS transporter [Oscillospiraceae bacterium]
MGKAKAADGKPRLNYPKTILTGFGFMGSSIAWAIYDPYITKILNKFLSASPVVDQWSARLADSALLRQMADTQGAVTGVAVGAAFSLVPLFIGVIMTFDNIFGVIFQPLFGKLSDRCHSRLGKRRPFILIGAPVSALLFALIPRMGSLAGVMACVILFVFVMSLWRSPVVALMPDLTPPALRSDGNAVINLMGGVGLLVGMVAGTAATVFYTLARGIPKGQVNEFDTFPTVFLIGSVVMLVGMAVVMLFVKEKDSRLLSADVLEARNQAERRAAERKAKAEDRLARKAMKLTKAERASLIFMLACLFFLFGGANAIQTFFALFAEEVLHIQTASATLLMALFGLCSMAAAIPAGKLGQKIGRKNTILLGLGVFLAAFLVFFAVFLATLSGKGLSIGSFTALNQSDPGAVAGVTRLLGRLVYPVMALAGAANMLITVNTLPLVLEIGGAERVGTFTGYYYTATFSAQIASPIAYGFFRMFSGSYISLFYYSPILFALAALAILFVRHGEAVPQELLEKAQEQGD